MKASGLSQHPLYVVWAGMLQRCKNPKHVGYANYGGRGIKVCERWHKFQNFLADMGERPAGKTLDRINNDGNYEPENCRWATRKEQSSNCGSPHPRNFKDMTGQRFGKLVVIGLGARGNAPQARWMCKCDCGKTSITYGGRLRSGTAKTCGCGRYAWRS